MINECRIAGPGSRNSVRDAPIPFPPLLISVLQPSSYLSQVATCSLIENRPGSYQDGSKRPGSYLVDFHDLVATRPRPGSYLVQIGASL